MRTTVRFVLLVGFLLHDCPALAQTSPDLERGLNPYESHRGGSFERVSMGNGNLFVRIPLLSYPQRGGHRFDLKLVGNNKGWYVRLLSGTATYWTIASSPGSAPAPVFAVEDGAWRPRVVNEGNCKDPLFRYYVEGPDGSRHSMSFVTGGPAGSCQAPPETVTMITNAETGFKYVGSNKSTGGSTLTARDGIRHLSTGREDTNGNQISSQITQTGTAPNGVPIYSYYYVDTLGRQIPYPPIGGSADQYRSQNATTTDYTGCGGPLPISTAILWNPPGINGGVATHKFCYVTINLRTNFQTGSFEFEGTATVLQSVVLPDGTTWRFEYSSRGPNDPPDVNYGDLSKITLPTGGYIAYQYGNVQFDISPGLGELSRAVTARTVNANDGTGSHTSTFQWGPIDYSVSPPRMTNQVTDPAGNVTRYVNTTVSVGSGRRWQERERHIHQGPPVPANLLQTVLTDYAGILPNRFTTVWPNGKVKKVERDYGAYGVVVAERSYNYGSGAPGNLLKQDVIDYVAFDNSSYLNHHIIDRPSSVTTCDGAGNAVRRTTFGYDETSVHASGIVTQRNQSPPNGSYRGNQTSIIRWLGVTGTCASPGSGGTPLTTTRTFFDTGMLHEATDPEGHTTSYQYASTFAGAFVTQTQDPSTNSPLPASHSTNGNYDFNTGLLTSLTDQNGRTTTYSYDNMLRFTTVSFSDGGVTNFYYPDSVTVRREQKIDAMRWSELQIRFDGLGRETRRIVANDESSPWDQLDRCFDSRGFVGFVSYPYQGTGFSAPRICSGAGDTMTYDALGRLVQLTHSDQSAKLRSYVGAATMLTDENNGTLSVQRVLQEDGLGRMTSVCEVTSSGLIGLGGSPAACGQDIPATGFLTTYAYDTVGNLLSVVQQGLVNRTFQYDSLSRLLSTSNPESGTIQYGYDGDDLVTSRTSPAPNQFNFSVLVTTLYDYDELHRLRTRTYQNDPSLTPSATFDYDQALAFGTPLANTNGRLSSSYVITQQGQTLSREILSYDNMGRVVDNSQCTPLNCPNSFFTVGYSYDMLGAVLSATNGTGITFTYVHNRSGRITDVLSSLADASHPAALVSNAKYNGFGGSTYLHFGNQIDEVTTYTVRGFPQSRSATVPDGASPGTGSVTISGSLQSTQAPPQGASPGAGWVEISGAEQSHTDWVWIPEECVLWDIEGFCMQWEGGYYEEQTTWDQGGVSITVNGVTKSVAYGYSSTAASLATTLANVVNADSGFPVTASTSGNRVNLTSKTMGETSNYSLSAASWTDNPGGFFEGPSFSMTRSGPTLTGGTSGTAGGTVYDSGYIWITVGGFTANVAYGQGDLPGTIAGALALEFNSNPASPVSATVNGSTVNLTSIQLGATTNYSLTAGSSTNEGTYFSQPSFSGIPSGSSLTGGADGTQTVVYSWSLGFAANGNILSSVDSVNGSWTYGYDAFNRLASAATPGVSYTYDYDRFGNRWHQDGPNMLSLGFDANNRIVSGSGVVYDAAGNVVNDGVHSYSYDAENRIVSVDSGAAQYLYNARGHRIRKISSNGTFHYVYDLEGRAVAEVGSSGTWNRIEVYAASKHVATYGGGSSGGTFFSHSDWLGTERARTDQGGIIVETCTSLPFGDGSSCTGTGQSLLFFTGKERDAETTNDYFGDRYYISRHGRWLTPDWSARREPIPYADLSDPQTLNLYAYVRNNPTTMTDRDGHAGGDQKNPFSQFLDYLRSLFNRNQPPPPPPEPVVPDPRDAAVGGALQLSEKAKLVEEAVTPDVSGSVQVGHVVVDTDTGVSVTTTKEEIHVQIEFEWGRPPEEEILAEVDVGKGVGSVGTNITKEGAKGVRAAIGPSVGTPVSASASKQVTTTNELGSMIRDVFRIVVSVAPIVWSPLVGPQW